MSVDAGLDEMLVLEAEFAFDMRCEYEAHMHKHVPDDPAKYFIEVSTECGCVYRYMMCDSGYNRMVSRATLCCRVHGDGVLYNVRVLDTIR